MLAIAFAFGATVACTTGSSSGGSSSGGSSGAASSASVADYCDTLKSYATTCNKVDACSQSILASCASYVSSTLSGAFVEAALACKQSAGAVVCTDGGAATAPNYCIPNALAAATPSAAFVKLKTDFCAACPDDPKQGTVRQCTDFLTAGDGGNQGIGRTLMVYSDAIAEQIDKQCLPGPADAGPLGCGASFFACAFTSAQQATPAACQADAGTTTAKSLSGPLPFGQ
jgi:hypothetical protein